MDLRDRRDARRLALAVAVAVVVHAGLLVVVPLLTSLDNAPLPAYGPVIVRVELPEAVLEPEPAPAPAPEPAPPVATPPRTTAKPAPAPRPATTTAPKPAATSPSAPAAPARAPGTSAFRTSGATTGVSAGTVDASIPQGPPPVTLPPAGVSTTGGGDQRSGEAVALAGRPTGGSGTIDPTKVDKALAAGGTTGGSGSTAPGATSPGTAATTSALTIDWEDEDAAAGRVWVKPPRPVVSDEKRDFIYGVRIWFRVNAEGIVTDAKVEKGSGQLDVDEACRLAVLKASVTPRRGAPLITGVQVFEP